MARTSRVCPKPGCPVLLRPGEQCPDHARPNSHRRGYDRQHRRTRADWAPAVAAGTVRCTRPECGRLIAAGEPWDLGHDDYDRSITRGPEHANGCNRAVAGRASQP